MSDLNFAAEKNEQGRPPAVTTLSEPARHESVTLPAAGAMSRFKRYAHALVSGYVVLAANTVFSLASVPLALHFLAKPEFGLWVLTVQILGFIGLVELGMTGAFARLLIDHKDDRASGRYGGLVQTGFLVSVAQGALVLAAGVLVSLGLGHWLDVESSLQGEFRWLMLGQTVLLAGTFGARTLTNVLVAHQRSDVVNVAQALSFGVNYGVMWLGFALGAGVFSLLLGQLAAVLFSVGVIGTSAVRLGSLPGRGQWGRVSWAEFREMFKLGKDVFLLALGAQMVFTSQTILVTRALGLEASALWSICTRACTLATQMIYRVFDVSCPALAEMMVRKERDRLFARFRSLVVVTTSLGVLGVAMLVTCNGSFVAVWTAGRFEWSVWNDLLLGLWLLVCALGHAHVGLMGQTKDFRALAWIFFLEGTLFVGTSWLLLPIGGVTAMLACSLGAALLCSFPYSLWRTHIYFDLSWKELLLDWSRPGLVLAAWVTPLALGLWWVSRTWPPVVRLAVCAGVLGGAGALLLLRVGLESKVRQEIRRRLPAPVRPMFTWLLGTAS